MIYTELVKKAANILFDAHKEDYDKSGYPYVFHPFFLATQMDDEASTIVALLHDVIEDHGDKYSFKYLLDEGFPKEVIDSLKLLTHDPDVSYMDYVRKIKANNIARKVKIADLKHNLDTTRSNGIKPKKYELYIEALNYLTN